MANLPETRLSDAEREATALRLREAAVEGRLTLEELSQRLDRAYAARTAAELEPIVGDLPQRGHAAPAARRAPRRWVVAVMGGRRIRGRFRLGGVMTVVAVMGGVKIDLRSAEIDADPLIRCFAFMGGVELVVPEGVEIEDEAGFALMGGRDIRVKDVPRRPETPVIRVRMYALMGGADVRSAPSRSAERGTPVLRRR